MKITLKRVLFATLFSLLFVTAQADEGMWLINLLEKNLATKMKKEGLRLKSNVIYDEESPSISDAIVSLDFGCTGSMVSQEGLLITNHHCAYGDIHSLSTPQENLLEEGFWAIKREDERPINGKSAFFLRRVLDVTDEVNNLSDSLAKTGGPSGFRRISSLMEKKYGEESGYDCWLSSMWRGSKYYLFFYEVYTDIRLVGAPPVSIGSYGGDFDNWEWPQHKGDFALYRVYADSEGKPAKYSKENIPLKPKKVLNISTSGVKEGSYTMILGFPGRTNRYGSSYSVTEKEKVTNPISSNLRKKRLQIMNSYMERDPETRLIYADHYFGISNVQEYQEGEIINFRRFGVANIKQEEERELQRWIESSEENRRKYGNLLAQLDEAYSVTKEFVGYRKYYQEAMVSGQGFLFLGNRANSLRNARSRQDITTLTPGSRLHTQFVNSVLTGHQKMVVEVEKELANCQLEHFTSNVPQNLWGDYLVEIYQKMDGNITAIINHIFDQSNLLDLEKFKEVTSKEQPLDLFIEDPLVLLANSTSMILFNQESARLLKGKNINTLESRYTRALYEMRKEKGIPQYPDANSTMRLTYGTVVPLSPSDGIYYAAQSTAAGFADKYNPDSYEFNINPKLRALYNSKEWGRWGEKGKLYINFLTNNDITGGNSGSPVLNAKGDIVGLAFDGNKESLAGDAYFHPDMNRSVNVDIRYVLWVIEKYAGAHHLIEELQLVK